MKKIIAAVVASAFAASMYGCKSMATVEKALNDAAAIATGPCAVKVSEALAVCNANPPLPPKK